MTDVAIRLLWSYRMQKKLSLIIPCYNEEKTLHECVNRVLALASNDLKLEIVIVDDCSKDDSLAVARELAWLQLKS